MYTVFLFDNDGFAIDFKFSRWTEAIEFMCSLFAPENSYFIETYKEWELCHD